MKMIVSETNTVLSDGSILPTETESERIRLDILAPALPELERIARGAFTQAEHLLKLLNDRADVVPCEIALAYLLGVTRTAAQIERNSEAASPKS